MQPQNKTAIPSYALSPSILSLLSKWARLFFRSVETAAKKSATYLQDIQTSDFLYAAVLQQSEWHYARWGWYLLTTLHIALGGFKKSGFGWMYLQDIQTLDLLHVTAE